MIFAPRLERLPDGVAFTNLGPAYVLMLLEVPDLLGPDRSDRAARRLAPRPSDDEEQQDEWERLVHPDLFALIASARDVVAGDLRGIEPAHAPEGPEAWRVEIPAKHVHAWISALNAARVTLGADHEIETEEDMHRPFEVAEEIGDAALEAQRLAVLKIQLLGELQALLILDQHPAPPGFEDEGPPRDDTPTDS